jgi:hypothetical protein
MVYWLAYKHIIETVLSSIPTSASNIGNNKNMDVRADTHLRKAIDSQIVVYVKYTSMISVQE